MEDDLPAKLAISLQKGLHNYLIIFQKNTHVKHHNILLNKNTIDFCITENHFMIMIRGNFYVENANDLILETSEGLTRKEIAAVEPKQGSGITIVISNASFKSLIASYLDPASSYKLAGKTVFTVEELENLIEGYSNAFDEEEKVQIDSMVIKTDEITFDETFGNIAFKIN